MSEHTKTLVVAGLNALALVVLALIVRRAIAPESSRARALREANRR